MYDFSDSFISKEVVDLAAAHGFTIEVCQDELAENPRDCGVTSTYVGGTRGTGSGVCDEQLAPSEQGSCIEGAVINFANKKGLDVRDLLWFTVHTYEHTNIALSLTSFNDRFDGGIGGFIFESKAAIRKEFGVERISSKLKEKIRGRLQSELEELTRWANGEVYEVSLLDEDENVVISHSGVSDVGNTIEDTARELMLEVEPA